MAGRHRRERSVRRPGTAARPEGTEGSAPPDGPAPPHGRTHAKRSAPPDGPARAKRGARQPRVARWCLILRTNREPKPCPMARSRPTWHLPLALIRPAQSGRPGWGSGARALHTGSDPESVVARIAALETWNKCACDRMMTEWRRKRAMPCCGPARLIVATGGCSAPARKEPTATEGCGRAGSLDQPANQVERPQEAAGHQDVVTARSEGRQTRAGSQPDATKGEAFSGR